jgi:hypothetical protein
MSKKIEVKQVSSEKSIEVKQPIKFVDDPKDLADMAEFYGKSYSEVYFVHDLKAGGVIAVECWGPDIHGPVERGGKHRDIFPYKGRLYTTRTRLDQNEKGEPMIGYESTSGNDTRLSKHERGEVPTVNMGDLATKSEGQAVGNLTPFEREQIRAIVANKKATSNEKADYEAGVDDDGRAFERFETFKIVRMK